LLLTVKITLRDTEDMPATGSIARREPSALHTVGWRY